MENNKKFQTYARQPKACQSSEANRKSTDIQSHKPWPRNSRHTTPRNEPSRNPKQQLQQSQQASTKPRSYADKRPRQRGGGGSGAGSANGLACDPDDIASTGSGLASEESANSSSKAVVPKNTHVDYELNSIYLPGNKKQNLNHLLNFYYEHHNPDGHSVFGRAGGGGGMHRHQKYNGGAGSGLTTKKHKYNKEQFLQANFQFVIKASAQPMHTASPDILIDWNSIEQINIQTTEEPQCPICLYPPIAAKLTRCGHVYCWPCILHYLALSDKSWRKCPICYEAVHTRDLKSTTIIQQRQLGIGDQITFHLMRRKKGSMFTEKFKSTAAIVEYYPQLSVDDGTKLFSKFVIAKDADVLQIIERERHELVVDEDASCPEYVFIQQALDLLNERRDKLNENVEKHFKPLKVVDNNDEQEQPMNSNDGEPNTALDEASAGVQEMNMNLDAVADTTTKYYYFYQCEDGQNIFLHPLNVKMLQACYDTLDCAPLLINARIVQKEQHSMDEEHRRKFTCLGHLPLTCQFSVVEVDLQPPIITEDVLKLFEDDVVGRQKERQRRAREERKREKHIEQINDRQMGKLIASTANLNLNSSHDFPTCGFEEPLGGASFMDSNPGTSASSTSSIPLPASSRYASYSSIAVTGRGSPKKEYWPTLASPTANAGKYYEELSAWGRSSTAAGTPLARKSTVSETSHDSDAVNTDGESAFLSPLQTTLSDVLAEAMATQKKQKPATAPNTGAVATAAGGNKKNKKSKKMQPLFTTGMSFNGN